MQKYLLYGPPDGSDQIRDIETDIDKRQNKTGGFRSHTHKKKSTIHIFVPKNFPVGDCMNHTF